MKLIFIFLALLAGSGSYAQQTQKIIVAREDPFDLYASRGSDSTTLFYEKIVPAGKPVAAIVILGGTFDQIEDIKKQITLHQLAVRNNFLVIFPSINFGTTKLAPEFKLLDTIFRQVVEKHKIAKDKFVIGGFSGGAMLALRYTERANQYKDSTYLTPRAVFGVDPPLDYAHLWHHCINDLDRNVSEMAAAESKMIMEEYTREFGGSPAQFPQPYIDYSIYSHDEKDKGNAKYLLHTPVLLFTEPDIVWQMKNRQRDYYDLNCVDIAAMINYLQIKGNKNAQLIVTHNKGKRLNGMRHPHSWSIMDSKICLEWITKQLLRI